MKGHAATERPAWNRFSGLANNIADTLNEAIHARYLKRPQAFCHLAGAKKLLLTADYSGHRMSPYRTVGLLLVNKDDVAPWKSRLQHLRKGCLGRRRLSYKDLRHDTIRRKALPHFLASADRLRGYCLAVAFAKNLDPLVEDVADHKGLLAPLAQWPKPLRLWGLYVTVVAATLIQSTCSADADFVFFTDEDELVSPRERLEQFVTLLRVVVRDIGPNQYGTITYGTAGMTGNNLFVEDMCAVPDLVAGALTDYLRSAGGEATLEVPSTALDPRARVVIDWMLTKAGGLTRLAAVDDAAPAPQIGRVRLLRRDP
ncbi:MAG TPA: hypothetical protein VNN17_03035 [Terriglobia bacterium]|nr:hypothetical protein [Terriglobia bacterium]